MTGNFNFLVAIWVVIFSLPLSFLLQVTVVEFLGFPLNSGQPQSFFRRITIAANVFTTVIWIGALFFRLDYPTVFWMQVTFLGFASLFVFSRTTVAYLKSRAGRLVATITGVSNVLAFLIAPVAIFNLYRGIWLNSPSQPGVENVPGEDDFPFWQEVQAQIVAGLIILPFSLIITAVVQAFIERIRSAK